MALAGGVGAAWLFGAGEYAVGPFRVLLEWAPSLHGTTQVAFPPLGEVVATTHPVPGRFRVVLTQVELTELSELLGGLESTHEELVGPLADTAVNVLLRFLGRLAFLATIGGGLLAYLMQPVHFRGTKFEKARVRAATSALFALLFMLALFSGVRMGYDLQAFNHATYVGALESLPIVVETVEEGLARVAELDARLRTLVRNVYRMYRMVESVPLPMAVEDADLVIAHVTDFHNHPAAAGVVVEVARTFQADLVINTGDFTDFGTPIEAELLKGLAELEVTHLVVSGNHESPAVLDALERFPGLVLLDERQTDVAGLRIAGYGDPAAQLPTAPSIPPSEARRMAQSINDDIQQANPRPDVILVHNHRVAQAIEGVPLVLFGHTHVPGVTFRSGTTYVNGGTTGGAGLRGLEGGFSVAISLAVIYLNLSHSVEVLAVDILKLSPTAGGFSLERHLVPRPEDTDDSVL